jgi:RNA polymerase sigma factor (sigma-70 family)
MMSKYLNKPMEDLAAELTAGLLRLRKGYVDGAEALLQILDADREYPYEFVVYRLTGYRPRRPDLPAEAMSGRTLRGDLLRLMLDVCDSFDLRAAEYDEEVLDLPSLARRLKVSTKTVQRWCRAGLPSRRLVFADGKRRLAFLESSLRWFVRNRRRQVLRSARFSQMSEEERQDVLRRAKRMASFTHCSLIDVSRRLAARTGRAVETIRYTLRRHDQENPSAAIFPYLSAPLSDQDRLVIYRCFLRGVSVPVLAERYRRTRGSIYRLVNEMRARQLMQRPIPYIYNPQFDLPNADETILAAAEGGDGREKGDGKRRTVTAPPDLPQYLKDLYEVPLLDAQQEHAIFRRYNYLKHKADKLRGQIDANHIRTGELKQIETLLLQANGVKNQIIRSNLRLVVSIAKKHLSGPQTLFELVSDGNLSLMRAVEKFDYFRGFRFSTYASWAIMKNFARSVPKERYQLDRFATGQEEVVLDVAALRGYDPHAVNLPELRESIEAMLAQLSPRERTILTNHYGLEKEGESRTLEQLSQRLGISKERVRQIEIQALNKLRRILHPDEADLLA